MKRLRYLHLTALARSADGDSATERVTWKSSAPNVVRVDESGVLTGVGPGRSRVTASAGAAEMVLDLTVLNVTGGSVTVTPRAASARQGDVLRFAVLV